VVFTDFLDKDMELLEKSFGGPLENGTFRYTKKYDSAIFKEKWPWKSQYPNPADSQGVKK